jgi:hypothetical protein
MSSETTENFSVTVLDVAHEVKPAVARVGAHALAIGEQR